MRVWSDLSKVLFYEGELLGAVDSFVKFWGYFYFTSETVTKELLKNLQFLRRGFFNDQSPFAKLLTEQRFQKWLVVLKLVLKSEDVESVRHCRQLNLRRVVGLAYIPYTSKLLLTLP